ncbi:MAG TPA: hypothetical protein VGC21_13460 [Telluria sp.]|jgi:hypothetical protein
MLETDQLNALAVVLEFWDALQRFDGLGESPATDNARMGVALAFFRGDVTAFDHIVSLVVQRLPHMSPRVQLLPFLSRSRRLVCLAEEVMRYAFPVAEFGVSGARVPYLSKREVCTLLNLSPAKLAELIASGQLEWPADRGRQQKIAVAEIEMQLQGFSSAEIRYLRSEEPGGHVHRHDKLSTIRQRLAT